MTFTGLANVVGTGGNVIFNEIIPVGIFHVTLLIIGRSFLSSQQKNVTLMLWRRGIILMRLLKNGSRKIREDLRICRLSIPFRFC